MKFKVQLTHETRLSQHIFESIDFGLRILDKARAMDSTVTGDQIPGRLSAEEVDDLIQTSDKRTEGSYGHERITIEIPEEMARRSGRFLDKATVNVTVDDCLNDYVIIEPDPSNPHCLRASIDIEKFFDAWERDGFGDNLNLNLG